MTQQRRWRGVSCINGVSCKFWKGRKVLMSRIRKRYMLRLVGRCVTLLLVLVLYFADRAQFAVLRGWSFFRRFSLLHLLWLLWVLDMAAQLFPIKGCFSLGSQKHFLQRFRPIAEAVNYKALKEHIAVTTRAAYRVFLIWGGVLLLLGVLYFTRVLSRIGIFFAAVLFYVCDLICVLIWCPFRLIMKNRCCTTCRIYNWDHLMMFSPFALTPGFYTTSILVLAFAVWVLWEFCVMLYPERFWEKSNLALQCSECSDKLCTQYCRKLR